MDIRRYLTFPDPVNEVAARTVAAGVVLLVLSTEITTNLPLFFVLAFGFVARLANGPRFSPLGRFATQVVASHWIKGGRLVPGPPKRFAQGIGAVFSSTALILALSNHTLFAQVLIGVLGGFAFLEAAFGLCAGCKIYGVLQNLGLVSEVCEDCSDLSLRLR